MRIQESLVTDKQIALELFSENGRYRLPMEGKDYYFPTLEKVHEAFLNQDTYDTIKLTHNGKKSYLHLFMDEIEVFDTKKALRQRLSQDSQGMWAEIRNGKTQYYVEERGWRSTSYKEITEQQCLERLTHTSTMTKVLGICLGMLALFPGALELARRLPIGTKEAAMGLVALNQKSPVLGAVGYSLLSKQVEAQALGTEFQVNTYTTEMQNSPRIAPLNGGGFVITWQSFGQDGDYFGIYGQRYSSNGTPAGSEFQVNAYTTNSQTLQDVAPLNNGGFVVTWASDGQDGDGYGIYGQRYDNSGSPAGAEFQVNTYTTDIQIAPSIAPLDQGFVITWDSRQDGDLSGIYGQRYDSAGTPAGTEFQVNTYTTNYQLSPCVAPLNDGGFVVIWYSEGQDGSGYGVYGQRYDNNGSPSGVEFQVNSYTTDDQYVVRSIAPLKDGGFIVIWVSDGQDGDLSGIYGQRYDNIGTPVGSEFQVNTYTTGDQKNPNVAPLNDGGFIITWNSDILDGSYFGVYGQRYDSNGAPIGSEFQVNTYTTDYQQGPNVAPLNDGGFIIAWSSRDQDGDRDGVFGQRYDANGNATALQLPAWSISPTPATIISQSNLQSLATPLTNMPTSTRPVSDNSKSPPSPSTRSTSKSSNTPIPSPGVPGSRSTPTLLATESPTTIVYEESYPILVNDQVVGSYTVSGGSGLLDSGNPNVIYFEFDPSFQPEEGQIITLFYVPEEEVALWESIEIEGESYECLEARGQVATNQGRSSYQMVFEDTECLAIAPTMLATALPLTVN